MAYIRGINRKQICLSADR